MLACQPACMWFMRIGLQVSLDKRIMKMCLNLANKLAAYTIIQIDYSPKKCNAHAADHKIQTVLNAEKTAE